MAHDYNIGAEEDLQPKVSRHIVLYLALLCVVLFATIYGLMVMFKFQLDHEKEQKIGSVLSHEMLDQKAMNEAYLSGKMGIFADKKNISIEEAKAKFLHSLRQTK